MKNPTNIELKREQAKLNHLVNEAIKNNDVPFSENQEILEQSRKVDALILKIQNREANRRKNEPSRG
jgi:hypothetical protein